MEILHFDWLRQPRSQGREKSWERSCGYATRGVEKFFRFIPKKFFLQLAFSWVMLKQLDPSPKRGTGLNVN